METFSVWVIKKAAKEANLDISKYDIKEIEKGMEEELEHGKRDKALDVTGNDPLKTLKIVLAHLKEDPRYYTKLKRSFS
jgi:hypothetical protein